MKSLFLLIFIPISIHILSIIQIYNKSFYKEIDFNILVYSTVDLLLSLFIITYLLKKFQYKFQKEIFSSNGYIDILERNKFIISVLVIISAYLAYKSFNLIMMGAYRHDLIGEYNTADLKYMILSGFFKIVLPFVLIFKSSLKLKVLSGLGLLFCLAITASRSELIYVLYMYLILFSISSKQIEIKQFLKLGLFLIIFISLAIFTTSVLQSRPISEGLSAFIDIYNSFFNYKAYSYYLSEYAMKASVNFENSLFPFFGYTFEYLSRSLFNSISAIDSKFVGQLHILGYDNVTGRPYLANVLYPWWSWFVGSFGFLGLFIKAIYIFMISYFLLRYSFYFMFLYFSVFIYFGVSLAHPMLTLTHVMSLFIPLILDLIIRIKLKKGKYT
jgi:hypothetical protein